MSALVTAGVAEIAASLLSLSWGFAVLVGAFIVVAVRMSSTVAAATAKSSLTETRLNAHIVAAAPAINLVANGGTIGGTTTIAGDHHITGNQGVTGSQTVTGQINGSTMSLSSGMTDFGHTSHGNVSVDNNITAGGDTTVGGNLSGPSGGTIDTSPIHSNGAGLFDGTIAASNFAGPYQGGQARPANTVGTFDAAHFTTACSTINTIMNELADAGLMT
jgi:hypothetical protein